MRWKPLRPALMSLAVIAPSAITAGCAEERDPINRVQANALDKAFFVGDLASSADDPEFYTQATLVDLGYGAGQDGLFTSTYTQGVARIKWVIQEDLLVGRLTYERVSGSDGKGAGAAADDGQIVVAYGIQSHFDIRHSYNPATGEELNVIEENASDRPWYDRQYMRVDWSKNLNTDAYDFDTLSMLGAFGIDYEPLAYYVSDPADPDAPHFDVQDGYFDVTNKAFATPGMIDMSHLGWGIDSYPACQLPADLLGGTAPYGNCNSIELTIRQSFRKVVDTDFEPADWDGLRFQSYGGFYTERHGYARNYGMSDALWHRFLNRYNIWERSHYYADPAAMTGAVECYTPNTLGFGEDPHADASPPDGTEDRCWMVTVNLGRAAGKCEGMDDSACYVANNWEFGGSRCDTFKQKCTQPYRHRQEKPVAWYYTNGGNLDYFDGTEWATHDHDVGMRHAIQVSRYSECMATADLALAYPDRQANCANAHPVYFGQMDDHLEAQQLTKEVDDCRHGFSYVGQNGQDNFGALNSADREAKCVALADSVAAARNGARTAGIDPGIVALARMPEQVVLCHSPVEANDPAACAAPEQRLPSDISAADCQAATVANGPQDVLDVCGKALNARRGDLRYHQVNVLKAPQTNSPWGIYTDSHDPLSGETFSASINVWSHVNDLWSQGVIDRIRFIKGELSAEDVTEAEYVDSWAKAAEAANGHGVAPTLTREERIQKVADFTGSSLEDLEHAQVDSTYSMRLKEERERTRTMMAAVDAPSTMAPIYNARRNAMRGTQLEAELITPAMRQLSGTSELPADISTQYSSIFGLQNPTFRKELRNMLENAMAARGICTLHEAPAPVAITGLADILEAKFSSVCASYDEAGMCTMYYGPFGSSGCTDPADDTTCSEDPNPNLAQARANMMRAYMAQKAHYAVIVHEMGHSVGERHNFVSSSDAYNFRPQYWQLRTNDGANADNLCADYTEDGSCTGPRYYDPTTPYEDQNMIWMWMHSSVMDYAGEYTQDFLGLGGYDMAAHRMFYGENVAVFADPTYAVGQPRAGGMISKMDNFGGILGIQPEYNESMVVGAAQDIHYSEIQSKYQVIYGCEPVDTATYVPASWDTGRQGAWHPVLDGLIVPNESGTFTKCKQQKVDYVPWQTLRKPVGLEYSGAGCYYGEGDSNFCRGGPSVDRNLHVRVPYGFATDSWADVGNASVYRHDNGADVYEVYNFFATQAEINHIFDNYRRGKESFSVNSAAHRTLERYSEKIRDGAKGLGLLRKRYQDLYAADGVAFNSIWGYTALNFFSEPLLASGMVFDHFTRQFARPEAGPHFNDGTIFRSDRDATVSTQVVFNVPNGATGKFGSITTGGALIENTLSDTNGEFDRDYTLNAGSYYDKIFVPYLLTESVDNFISDSRNDFVDSRYRAVSMADLFPEGYRRWLANNLTGDEFIKGVRLAADAGGNPLIDFQSFPAWPLGVTTWWGDEVKACFPALGSNICGSFNDQAGGNFDPRTPDNVVVVDPQVGYEQQKFIIAQTMMYLPEDNQQEWIDMMRLFKDTEEETYDIGPHIELHDPRGVKWIANTYGREEIFGKQVQKGVAARVLEYDNELINGCYDNTAIDYDLDGIIDWYEPNYNDQGEAIIKFDPDALWMDPDTGAFNGQAPEECDEAGDTGCKFEDNHFCAKHAQYTNVMQYLYQFVHVFMYDFPDKQGVWE
jgi:hypothetical protein